MCVSLIFMARPQWTVVEYSGDVRINSETWSKNGNARIGSKAPSEMSVGDKGYLVIEKGNQRIILRDNTKVTIEENDNGGFTVIRQDGGSATYNVDTKKIPHFRVETENVAAVVKGTVFDVNASTELHSVVVREGIVEATSRLTGQVEMVHADHVFQVALTGDAFVSQYDNRLSDEELSKSPSLTMPNSELNVITCEEMPEATASVFEGECSISSDINELDVITQSAPQN